ncbi:MAG: 3'-5' exonuclease, partial [Dissulfurimicrobium sp.]
MSSPIAAFDLETTGLSPRSGARIIEIGAVIIKYGVITAEFSSLIYTSQKIPLQVTRIHGITNDMLDGQPMPEDVFPAFMNFIGKIPLIAHNAHFDFSFLRHELRYIGFDLFNEGICTLELSRRLLPHLSNHRLETVARHLLGDLPEGIRL